MINIDTHVIGNLFQKLNENYIQYVLIKNIGEELPDKLKYGKDIDILLDFEHDDRYARCMKEMGFEDIVHPESEETGWQMLYGVHNPKKKKIPNSLEVDVHYELAVQSIQKRQWCPLDKMINQRVWKCKQWDSNLNCWKLDEKTLLVYLIARCVFDKETFSEAYKDEINKRESMLDDSEVTAMLERVFFRYTPYLIREIKAQEYDTIVKKYLAFDKY